MSVSQSKPIDTIELNSPVELNGIVAIGDIHGSIFALKKLIESIDEVSSFPLLFLGDYIDRGAYSFEVIEYLIELQTQRTCFFLRGNHEALFLDCIESANSESTALTQWVVYNGGEATLKSYTRNGCTAIPRTHIEFLQNTRYYLAAKISDERFFFVHGGLKPQYSIVENLTRCRYIDFLWERSHLTPDYLEGHVDYAWEATVVCGHTPQKIPLVKKQVIAIDTGCVYTEREGFGKLTAVILPERTLIQVENKR